MHEQLDSQKHLSAREKLALVIIFAVTVVGVILSDRIGMPQKWHAAIVGTTFPFVFVIFIYPSSWWRRWSFWAALTICLITHLIAIWAFFQFALRNVNTLGWALWIPIAFVEAFVLIFAIKKIADAINGKREEVEL